MSAAAVQRNPKYAKLRVLFVVPRFHTNQVGWVAALQDASCDVAMLAYTVGPTEDHAQLKPTVLPESRLSRLVRRSFGDAGSNRRRHFPRMDHLWSYLCSYRAQLVIIRPHGAIFTLAAAVMARLSGSVVLYYRQRVEPVRLGPEASVRSPLGIAFSVALHLVSRRTITPIWAPSEPDRKRSGWFTVPFTAPPSAAAQRARYSQRDGLTPVRIMTVGKLVEKKRIDLVIRAVAQVEIELGRQIRLDVVGECSSDLHQRTLLDLKELAYTLGIAHRVSFHTNVPPKDMACHYQSADVFVLASETDVAPISVIEALGHGLPVICSDGCGTSCYIREGHTGSTFASGSLASLRAALHEIVADTAEMRRRGEEASRDSRSRFSGQAFVRAFNAALEGTGLQVGELHEGVHRLPGH